MLAATLEPRVRFVVALLGWSAALIAVLRSPVGQQALVAPFSWLQALFAYGLSGGSPVTVDLSCSGSEVIALSIAALLAFPDRWPRRLAGVAVVMVALCGLNLVRIITLLHAAGSPVFYALHAYIWPGVMIAASAIFVGAWIWQGRRVGAETGYDDAARNRRFATSAAALLLVYVAATPWLLAASFLQTAAITLADTAALLLRTAGIDALTSGGTLVVGQQTFLVTPECLLTPLMPLGIAWALVWPRRRAARVGFVALLVPIFATFALARLLTVALPGVIGPPLHFTHGFYQLMVGALLLIAVSYWSARAATGSIDAVAGERFTHRAAMRTSAALLTAVVVAAIVGGPYTALVRGAARWLVTPPAPTFSAGEIPSVDTQGALAILPGYELALLCGLSVALWAWRAPVVLLAVVPAGALLQAVTLIVAGELAVRYAAEAPVTLVRALAIATPCALIAAAAGFQHLIIRRRPPLSPSHS